MITTANYVQNNCKTPKVQDAQPDHFNNHRVQERMPTNANLNENNHDDDGLNNLVTPITNETDAAEDDISKLHPKPFDPTFKNLIQHRNNICLLTQNLLTFEQ